MKIRLAVFAVIAAVLFVSGCGPYAKKVENFTENSLRTPTASSMKGYELYSWQDGIAWNYCLLEGTNAVKSYEDITTSYEVVEGEDKIIAKLQALPSGVDVFWNLANIKGFSLPPSTIGTKIKAACDKAGLNLQVIGWE